MAIDDDSWCPVHKVRMRRTEDGSYRHADPHVEPTYCAETPVSDADLFGPTPVDPLRLESPEFDYADQDRMNRTRGARAGLEDREKTSGENELDNMHDTLTRMWWTLLILVCIVLLQFFVVLTVIRGQG